MEFLFEIQQNLLELNLINLQLPFYPKHSHAEFQELQFALNACYLKDPLCCIFLLSLFAQFNFLNCIFNNLSMCIYVFISPTFKITRRFIKNHFTKNIKRVFWYKTSFTYSCKNIRSFFIKKTTSVRYVVLIIQQTHITY